MKKTSTLLTYNLCLTFILLFFNSKTVFSQEDLDSDELFKLARTEAFDNSNYPKAISLSKKALESSPDYADIRIFLGRLYTWSDKPDSARMEFKKVLALNPKNEDALSANFDVEYFNDQYSEALQLSETALNFYPGSEDFIIRKAKALNALERSKEAYELTSEYLIKNPESKLVSEQNESLKDGLRIHRIGVGYSFIHFDKRFDDPWQIAGIYYGNRNKSFSYTLGVNYANRFNSHGTEIEGESYPQIVKGLYAYVGAAAALSGDGLYPKYRVGVSLYKSLPKSFEAELGIRHLQFSTSTDVFVLGLGKYLGNNFYNVRSYLTPSDGTLSASVNLIVRFILNDNRDDFFGFNLGTGASPDDRSRLLDVPNLLNSFKAGLDFSHTIKKRSVITFTGTYINEEYLSKTYGNQYNGSVSFQHKF
ncbi:YaiO family outer membrane beta-barrel protein [Daejeonella oryzae]|uniref:YaiO family outer membrane beta-barrel protein n=1 Tax=Daejeonella oryzae TaxID=1122943 RepID=UPI00040AF441|nr:YaiO family outer membrane beta-barrel protein [Daejeonella oryzae]